MHLDELRELAEESRRKEAGCRHCVRVCMAAGCQSSGATGVLDALRQETDQRDDVVVKGVGCMGLCAAGPLVSVEDRTVAGTPPSHPAPHEPPSNGPDSNGPDSGDPNSGGSSVKTPSPEWSGSAKLLGDILYQGVTAGDANALAQSLGKRPVERLVCPTSVPFFTQQHKLVLAHSGLIDPEQIDDYLAVGGYEALVQGLTEMNPVDVLREVRHSGLRGRGGGGYPTGLKWSTVAKMPADQKFVICNADEGDPGAFMDRAILESDPHRVIEGMSLAAYAVGAQHGFIYIRAEYPLAIDRLQSAIRQANRNGFLGKNICETRFSFDIDIRLGAGAFVCGEETALMASIEGQRGQPRPRPPYPAEYGLWGHPTLINNVETLANITTIVRDGGDRFAQIGTERSKGTKVFALAGRVQRTGLIEVPMGVPLRTIIETIGGGVPEGHSFKAVQTGGPSGGCLPAEFLDLAVEYDTLRDAGSIMGSGGMIVMDRSSSMVDVARYFMEFCMDESCGKCIPCRAGTEQMHRLLDKIARGEARQADLDLLEQLCDMVKATSLCGLGQTAPNPVLSTLRYFRDEYEQKLLPDDSLACTTASPAAETEDSK